MPWLFGHVSGHACCAVLYEYLHRMPYALESWPTSMSASHPQCSSTFINAAAEQQIELKFWSRKTDYNFRTKRLFRSVLFCFSKNSEVGQNFYTFDMKALESHH